MTPEQFRQLVEAKKKEIQDLAKRKMPVLAGNIAKRHIEDDFRGGGFTNGGRKSWAVTKRQQSSSGASAQYGPLLSGRNNLSGSIQYTPGQGSVVVYTRVPYASIHNKGGVVHPTVTKKMRGYAWSQHYKEAGADKGADTMWKRLALTKKNKLSIKIPKRQFMPDEAGPELSKKVSDKLESELINILKK